MFPHRALGVVLILELVKSLDELGVEMHLVEQHWQVSVGEELLLQLLPCFYQTFFDIPPFSLHNQGIFLSWTLDKQLFKSVFLMIFHDEEHPILLPLDEVVQVSA